MDNWDNFWLCFAAIASTLSGFTLASYSIHITRAEVVASDPICRHYALRESASRYSLVFIFFILGMFLAPLLASLVFLIPDDAALALFVPAVVLVILILVWGMRSIKSTAEYLSHVAHFQEEVINLDKCTEGGLNRKPKGLINWISLLVPLSLIVVLMVLVLLWLMVLATGKAVDRGGFIVQIAASLPAWMLSVLPPVEIKQWAMWVSLLSVGLGIIFIYFYFRIFNPLTLLFEVGDGTKKVLRMTMHDIEDKRKSVVKLQKMFEAILRKRDERWTLRLRIERGMQESEVEKLLVNEKRFAQGRHWDPVKEQSMSLVGRYSYHRKRLDLCLTQKYVCYDQVIAMMTDVDRYFQGLSLFEERLKEKMREYQEIIRFLDAREKTTG